MKQSTKNILKVNILLILAMLLTACGPSGTWDEHYDLGIKYLSDGNYKEAIIEFETAIKIDDMKPKAYIGAADAYVGMEEYQKAIKILETGYEKCEDEEIYKKLQQLKFEYDDTDLNETFYEWGIENLMTLDEFTLNNKPIYAMSWNEALKNVQSIYAARGSKYEADGEGGFEIENGPKDVEIFVYKNDGGISVEYGHRDGATYLGWRDIKLGENLESVLRKLGFSQEGIEYINFLSGKEGWNEIPMPYDPEQEGGGCIGLEFGVNDTERSYLIATYVKDYSDSDGDLINFNFNVGTLESVRFGQNDVTFER